MAKLRPRPQESETGRIRRDGSDGTSGGRELVSPGPQSLDLRQQLELAQVALRHLHQSGAQLAAASGHAVLRQAGSVLTHLLGGTETVKQEDAAASIS